MRLLRLVVEDVVETGEPVGSQRLAETSGLDVSPATIRNWFAELEELGYLEQPHTSSGRVPTEKGYRFYLNELMQERTLRQRELHRLQQATTRLSESADQLKHVARALAELARDAVICSDPRSQAYSTGLSNILAQPEFSARERVLSLGESLDRMDDIMKALRDQSFTEPTALIGKDCPFGDECGSVFLTLKDGTLVGLLGPIRMNYSRGFTLLRAMNDLLDEG